MLLINSSAIIIIIQLVCDRTTMRTQSHYIRLTSRVWKGLKAASILVVVPTQIYLGLNLRTLVWGVRYAKARSLVSGNVGSYEMFIN